MDGPTTKIDIPSTIEEHIVFGMKASVLWTRERSQAAIRRQHDDPEPHGGLIYKAIDRDGLEGWYVYSTHSSQTRYPRWQDAAAMAMRISVQHDTRLPQTVLEWFKVDRPTEQSGLDF